MFLKSFLEKRSPYPPKAKGELEEKVRLVQEGNQEVRNLLIQQSTLFITQVTSKVCKRYINPAEDDEFSVAMAAFDEAMMKYVEGKGSSFLSYADLVIRRRVIDFIRKESRHRVQLFLEYPSEENGQSNIETEMSIKQYKLDYETNLRREEIQHYKEKLKQFQIDLMELPELSPKHSDARQNAIQVASVIVKNDNLRSLFLKKGKLPLKELISHIEVSRKTVERNRNYIVAIAILLLEDYQYLHSYIS